MKNAVQFILALLVLASSAVYVFYIDAPERWLTPGAVALTDDGMCITLTNISDEPVTVTRLGFAWKVDHFKHHMLLFTDQPRKILPRETFTERRPLTDLGPYLPAIRAAEKYKLMLTIVVDGKRKGGVQPLSRLPVILCDTRTAP
jgi:hypothetical protein